MSAPWTIATCEMKHDFQQHRITLSNTCTHALQVSFDYMTEFIIDTFEAFGVPAPEAERAADVLIEADKRGISVSPSTFPRYASNLAACLYTHTQARVLEAH